MPNRWIKEAYCASSRINAVGPEARDLWVRLLVNADDYGYFHGDARLVASACFPLQPNARKCEQLLQELNASQLIVRYESDGKSFLAMSQWYERPRSKPKYPPPPEVLSAQLRGHENNCAQLHVSTTTSTTTSTPSAPNDETLSFDAVAGWRGLGARRERWKAAYPAVDVAVELAKAAEWLRANPKNHKSNYERFLTNWLARAQDRAPARGGGSQSGQPNLRSAIA